VAQTGQQSQERSSLRHAGSEASGEVRFAAVIGVHHFRFGFTAALLFSTRSLEGSAPFRVFERI
jgi:hypothetical protein